MVIASQNFEETPKQVIVIGSRRSELVRKFIEFFNDRFLPNYCVLSLDKEKDSWLLSQNEHLRILCESAEEPSVHVCENFTCKLPLTTIDSLKEEFGEKGHFPMLEEVSRVFCR
ncbi:hypothetical protein AB6A40_010402 [Gnathostoma spinigerum]|uniref:Uncharacterized protein n=1 Tax=Gnathostoma spinigerum TaxID=75299 RepID=A0ABD6EUS0_9BILA